MQCCLCGIAVTESRLAPGGGTLCYRCEVYISTHLARIVKEKLNECNTGLNKANKETSRIKIEMAEIERKIREAEEKLKSHN